ncbi:MAG: hypothetical protein IK123_03140 [Lachnospiraceae bacterium]|nr:hypothetical protein [Lachnospiraceae bacterium]
MTNIDSSKNEYLSDEELMALIKDTEENQYPAAPPDIARNVIDKIVSYENARAEMMRRKRSEYRRFCIRVGVAVAAAIAIMVMAPFITLKLKPDMYQTGTVSQATGREEVLKDQYIPAKNEVVKNNIPTKEEALDHDRLTGMIRDSHYINDFYNSEGR